MKTSAAPYSSPAIMPSVRGVPSTARARGSSRSGSRLQKPPCESLTHTSVAPPANAPSIAALASSVIQRRAASYSPLPARVCSGWKTPATPSISVETRIFIAYRSAGGSKQLGKVRYAVAQRQALVAVAAGDGLGAPQRIDDRLFDAVRAGAKKRVHAVI